MTKENFCYWLQGFIEIGQSAHILPLPNIPNKQQWAIIVEHLNLTLNSQTKTSPKTTCSCGKTPEQQKTCGACTATSYC